MNEYEEKINAQALGVCIDRTKQLIEEYHLEPSQELGEAMAKMFQEGVAFAYQSVTGTEI